MIFVLGLIAPGTNYATISSFLRVKASNGIAVVAENLILGTYCMLAFMSLTISTIGKIEEGEISAMLISKVFQTLTWLLCVTNTAVVVFSFWAFYGEMIWFFLITIFGATFFIPAFLFMTFDREWYKPIVLAPIYIFGMSYFLITL